MNIGAALGHIATGGGAEHMKEQLACFQVPSLSTPSFNDLECDMGAIFEEIVTEQLHIAGQKEKELAIQRGSYHNSVPAITVVVDGGWSKRSHGHSYNANSGFGVIFGAATKGLLFIGVRISTVLYVLSMQGEEHQHQNTAVFVIGQVALAAWRLTYP